MRDLNTCKAEIFRLSQEKIKNRKKNRNRALACCIPLALCLSLLSLYYFPKQFSDKAGEPPQTNEMLWGSLTTTFAKIEVTGAKLSLTHTDASQILAVCDILLADTGTVAESNDPGAVESEMKDENSDGSENTSLSGNTVTQSYGTSDRYTITLVAYDGAEVEYYLAGDTLTNAATKRKTTLPQNKLEELRELLGIPGAVTLP